MSEQTAKEKFDQLGRIQAETPTGLLYVSTGFGSQMTVVRPGSEFMRQLRREGRKGEEIASIINSFLYLILECDPSIPGCDADEQTRRLKALKIALESKPERVAPEPINLQGGGE